jgi:hypothetical protein
MTSMACTFILNGNCDSLKATFLQYVSSCCSVLAGISGFKISSFDFLQSEQVNALDLK